MYIYIYIYTYTHIYIYICITIVQVYFKHILYSHRIPNVHSIDFREAKIHFRKVIKPWTDESSLSEDWA